MVDGRKCWFGWLSGNGLFNIVHRWYWQGCGGGMWYAALLGCIYELNYDSLYSSTAFWVSQATGVFKYSIARTLVLMSQHFPMLITSLSLSLITIFSALPRDAIDMINREVLSLTLCIVYTMYRCHSRFPAIRSVEIRMNQLRQRQSDPIKTHTTDHLSSQITAKMLITTRLLYDMFT